MIFDVFRKSDSTRVLSPQDLDRVLRSGSESSTGISVSAETASRFGVAFACVRVRAESIGQLPLHFYERRGERDKMKALNHPLYALLHDAPNEATTSQEFWEWVSASLDLRGNAYVFINRLPSGVPFELLQLDASWVQVKRDQKRDIYYEVTVPGAGMVRYPASSILHIKQLSLDGGLTGASVIEQARNTFGLGMALEQHGARFFKNGAAPTGVLQTDQVLTEATYKELRDSWEEAHGGMANAHRVAVLEAGLTWHAVSLNMKDAQFLEGRKFQRSEIAGLFRVPPHLIGDLERATFSNIEQQGLDFVIHGLMPTLTRIEQRIKLQLVAQQDRQKYFAKFQVGGLVRGDMAARGAFYNTLVQNGALSPNEIRDLEDMNPREGGDIFLTPLNMNVNGKPPEAGGATNEPAQEEHAAVPD